MLGRVGAGTAGPKDTEVSAQRAAGGRLSDTWGPAAAVSSGALSPPSPSQLFVKWKPSGLLPSHSSHRIQVLGVGRVAPRFMVQPFLLHPQCQRDAPQELSAMPVLGLPAPDPRTQEMPWAPVWRCRRVSASVALTVRGTCIEAPSFVPPRGGRCRHHARGGRSPCSSYG